MRPDIVLVSPETTARRARAEQAQADFLRKGDGVTASFGIGSGQQQPPHRHDSDSDRAYYSPAGQAGPRVDSAPPLLLPRDRRLMGGVGYAAPHPAPLRVLRASENVEFSPADAEAAAAARENLKRFMPLPKSVTAYRSYGEVGEVLAPPFGSASLPRDSLHKVKLFDPMTGPKM